ncbi:MAG TPA: hypothetical protein VFI42_04010 [Thermomicrobiaceae bacterium]|nr:hypothetical protein [Thermomicrobiaceae bacterium]
MTSETRSTLLDDPPIAQRLFSDTRLAWLWLAARLWLGWWWLQIGRQRVGSPDWMNGGAALRDYWDQLTHAQGAATHPLADGWSRAVLHFLLDRGAYHWLAPLAAVAETLVGLALILGAFTALAAFLGILLSVSHLLAGTSSLDPLLLVLAIGLILAWKTAGWLGFDRWLLPMLGVPGQGGALITRLTHAASRLQARMGAQLARRPATDDSRS